MPMIDACIDCDGIGRYPSGAQCRSCGGSGRVCPGDGMTSYVEREPDWNDPNTPPDGKSWHGFIY